MGIDFSEFACLLIRFSSTLHNQAYISTSSTQWVTDFCVAEVAIESASFKPHRYKVMVTASASPRRNQFLEWFPFYVHRFVGDVHYRTMKDYHQAWFLNLLFASWVSARPGYLPDDGQLWRLANARTRQFFDKESEPVICMFEREGTATDGVVWIYNRTLLGIYDEQVLKFHKKRRKSSKSTDDETVSYLDFEGTLKKKENGREECSRHPESGLTQWGTCWGCYAEKYSSEVG
jgi:hypothetical protein